MGDWLHCNSCFLQPGEGTKFNLTSCSHVYCEKCLEKGACKEKCAMCGSSCSVIPLSGKMKPDIDVYFKNPSDFISESAKKALEVLEFQGGHRARFVSFLRHEIKKMRSEMNHVRQAFSKFQALERDMMQEKKEYLVIKEELIKARKELVHLREENNYLKSIISEKGLGHPSPGAIRAQRASPSSRGHMSTSLPLSRGPSPGIRTSESSFTLQPHSRGPSPMHCTENVLPVPCSRGKSPGVRSCDMMMRHHQNISPSSRKTPEGFIQRTPASVMSNVTQQGYPISHPASHTQNGLPKVMITSGRLQVRTPPSGGKIGRIGTTPPPTIPATPKSAPQLISVAGYTPRLMKLQRNET